MDEQGSNLLDESGEMVPQTTPQMTPELRKRRSTRIVQAVPLVVTGVDALGRPFQERTSTLIINCHGCRYQSKHYVLKNMWISLEIPHPESGQGPRTVRGRVAWIQRPRTVRQLFQVAIELEVAGNAWGIAFPPEDWFAFPEARPGDVSIQQLDEEAQPFAPETQAPPVEVQRPVENQVEGVHVLPAPTSTDVSVQFARQVTRLLADAKQQIQTAAREAAAHAVTTELTSARQEWEARFVAAREELSTEVARLIEALQQEVKERSLASQSAAAETLQQELPKWLEPQLEQFTRDLEAQLLRDASAHGAAQEESLRNAAEIVGSARATAEEAAERVRARASQAEAALHARAEAATRALDEGARRQEEAAEKTRELLATAAEEHLRQFATASSTAEASWQEKVTASLNATKEQLTSGIESMLAAAVERSAASLKDQARATRAEAEEEAVRQKAAMQEAAAAVQRDLEARIGTLREGLNADLRRAEETQMGVEASRVELEGLAARTGGIQKAALENFQSHLTNVLAQRGDELRARAEALSEELLTRVRAAFDETGRDAAGRFEEQIRSAVEPHITSADEAVQRLAGGRALLDAAVTLQQDRIRGTTEEAFAEALTRFHEHLGRMQKEFHESAQAAVARNTEDFEARAGAMKHATVEELFKSAEWYEKKAQTQFQQLMEKSVEQTAMQFRERAGEVSSVFAAQLDGYSRNFTEHAQGQLEESVRESFERARALFAEAAETTSAAFTDEIQRHAREELDGFDAEVRKTMEESRVQADALRHELGVQMTAEQEDFLRRFRVAMAGVVEAGVGDAQEQVQAGVEPVLESWRAMRAEHETQLRALFGKASDDAIEQYRGRLENASNSWMVAAVTTLDRQSRDVLNSVAQAAEEKLRETFGQVLGGIGEALRARLQEIAGTFPPSNAKAAGSGL